MDNKNIRRIRLDEHEGISSGYKPSSSRYQTSQRRSPSNPSDPTTNFRTHETSTPSRAFHVYPHRPLPRPGLLTRSEPTLTAQRARINPAPHVIDSGYNSLTEPEPIPNPSSKKEAYIGKLIPWPASSLRTPEEYLSLCTSHRSPQQPGERQ
jgi:hypothetical protein